MQKLDGVRDDEQVPRFVAVEELFKGRHFDQEIVVLFVRWYLSYKLSYRDLVGMMDERGVVLAHTTILRWVQYYTPEFQKRWRMDETYVEVPGTWVYLYRAVDKAGKTVDFYLSRKCDVDAAEAFLRKGCGTASIGTTAPDYLWVFAMDAVAVGSDRDGPGQRLHVVPPSR